MVVIELDRNINFEFEIFPICLPKIATVGRDSRKGQIATVTGTVYTYIRTVSSQRLLSTLLIQIKLVYGLFGQSNMHSTLDSWPRPDRRDTNVPLDKRIS